ncbi:MAG: DUF4383 domain-containing protein [Acidimicrobiales bacterium]
MATHSTRVQYSQGATTHEVAHAAWSPAQIVTVVVGLFLLVTGAVGLAHTGFNFSSVPSTRRTLLGMPFTSVSALAELIAGVVVLAPSAAPRAAKATASVLGVIILAWGLIVALDTAPFGRYWAYDRQDGILYVVIGAVLLVTAAVSPVFLSRREVRVTDTGARAGDLQQTVG